MSTTLDLRNAQRLFYGPHEAKALYYGGTLLWTKPGTGGEPEPAVLPVTDGLVARWEADTGVSLDTDGTSVLSWQDSVGGLTPSGRGTVRPQLASGHTPSGAPAIVFDGANDIYAGGNQVGLLPAGSAARTVLLVANYHADASNAAGFAYGTASTNQTFGVVAYGTNMLAVMAWGGSNDLVSTVNALEQPWLVQSATYEGAGGQLTLWRDGTAIANKVATLNTVPHRLAFAVNIGGNTGTRRQMDIAAVLVFDRLLTEAERASVRDYLWAKYLTPPAA